MPFYWLYCCSSSGYWIRQESRNRCQHYCFCFAPDPTRTFQLDGVKKTTSGIKAIGADAKPLLRETSKTFKKEPELGVDTRTASVAKVDGGDAQIQVIREAAIKEEDIEAGKWKRRLTFLFTAFLAPFLTGGNWNKNKLFYSISAC